MSQRNIGPLRADSLSDLPPCAGGVSRRSFCATAGAGLITLGLPACVPMNDPRVTVGALDADLGAGSTSHGNGDGDGNGNNVPGPDLATVNPDLATALPQPPSGGSCPSGVLNAGAASAFTINAVKYFTDHQSYDLFVCRDSGGLYAVSAICPHAGCSVRKNSSEFYCPCHGATFDLNGENPSSPAYSPLDHYPVCIDGSGDVIVDYNSVVAASARA